MIPLLAAAVWIALLFAVAGLCAAAHAGDGGSASGAAAEGVQRSAQQPAPGDLPFASAVAARTVTAAGEATYRRRADVAA